TPITSLSPTPAVSYTLSLHDALPISATGRPVTVARCPDSSHNCGCSAAPAGAASPSPTPPAVRCRTSHPCSPRWRGRCRSVPPRSEEHTSELQSRFDLVCRLLIEKEK